MLTKSDINQIKNAVRSEVKDEVKTQLKPLKKDLSYLKKTVETLIDVSDREDTFLKRRVKKIEEHLDLPSL